jgi:hypothetical protein
MRPTYRGAIVIAIAMAFIAGPAGALCDSCCPQPGTGQAVGAPMPCCDDGCAPALVSAQPTKPAVAVARATLDPPSLTPAALPCDPDAFHCDGFAEVFVSSSPPIPSIPISSILRL